MDTAHTYPKLHNAMWPGLVGKGPDSEPPIEPRHHARPDRRGRGGRRSGSTAWTSSPPPRTRRIDASERRSGALADAVRVARPGDRLDRGAGLAAGGRRLGDGQRGGARAVRRRWSARPAVIGGRLRRAGGAAATASSASTRATGVAGLGGRPGRQHARASRRRSARRATSPRTTASGWPPRARSAGAACMAGATCSICWRRSAGRTPSASRPTWRTRCSTRSAYNAPEDRIVPDGFRLGHGGAGCGAEDHDRRAAALDHRLPRGAERRHREGHRAVARQDRAGTACRTTRTASSTSSTTPASGCAATDGEPTRAFQHICWDGCMFANEAMTAAGDLEQHPRRDDRGARRARLVGMSDGARRREPLNVGLVGCGFMGRTHSNAFRQVGRVLRPAVPAGAEGGLRPQRRGRARRSPDTWGYDSVETDWRALVERAGHRPDRHRQPNDTHAEIAIAAAQAGKMVMCEKPLGRTAAESAAHGRGGRGGRRRQHGLVQLPPGAGRDARQAADRRGPARPHLPLPRQVPAGLDHLARICRRAAPALWRLDASGRRQRRDRRPAGPLHRHRACG